MSRAHANWLRQRRKGIGSSDAPIVLGASPWRSRFDLWAEKVGLLAHDARESEAMRAGHYLEPVVARWYADDTKRLVVNGGRHRIVRSTEHPWMLATPDRYLPNPPEGKKGPGVLEIKTTDGRNADQWESGPPEHVRIQVQHQLAVLGYRWASVAVLIGGNDLAWCDVDRDEEFIAGLVESERAFWQHVADKVPPEVSATPDCTAALARLYPNGRGRVALPPEFSDLDAERERLRAEVAEREERLGWIDNTIRATLGDAEEGVVGSSNVVYRWRRQERAAYTVPATSVRVLRRIVES